MHTIPTQHTIIVTGGAGYVGEILTAALVARDDVRLVIVIDKAPETEFLKALDKVVYIEENLADATWQEKVAPYEPDVIIHTAWQIRELYGRRTEQAHWNIDGTQTVFAFAFTYPSVKKLIHFSTAASYSALPTNSLTHYFTEEEALRDDAYSYAAEKKLVEDNLRAMYEAALQRDETTPQVTIIRPAAITGPRGRFLRSRFGLQAALRGDGGESRWGRAVTFLTKVFPATSLWVRQFIHEDDIAGLVTHFACTDTAWSYEIFNGTPTGAPVYPKSMAKAVGKRVIYLWPFVVQVVFGIFWHLSKGRIPTCPHSWRFYSYPILMSGEKLAKEYRCRYSAIDAITYTDGLYEADLPPSLRHSKPDSRHE
jgi:nucleoside-diphosphate-sugar epimerase